MNLEVFWNQLNLLPPKQCIVKLTDDTQKITAQNVKHLYLEITEFFINHLNSFHMEAAALSRLMYRLKKRLRLDKGIQAMVKVNQSLNHYLNMNFIKDLVKISESLKSGYGPSKQMLQWVLVRLQGLAKIFHRVYRTCLEAGEQLNLRLKTGHLWNYTLVALAITSRIWTFSMYIVKNVCEWYLKLYNFLDNLKSNQEPWLPEDYVFPKDLIQFLDKPAYLVKQTRTQDSEVISEFLKDLGKEEGGSKTWENKTMQYNFEISDDLGEEISREQIKTENIHDVVLTPNRKRSNNNEDINLDIMNNQFAKKKKKKVAKNQLKPFKNETLEVVEDNDVEYISENKSDFISTNNQNNSDKALKDIISSRNKDKIDRIQSYDDLQMFLKSEQKNRSNNRLNTKCLTRYMDNLQFQMFSNFISKYLIKLKKVNKVDKLESTIKKLHQGMYTYLSN